MSPGVSADKRSGAKAPPSMKLGTTVLFAIAVVLGGREGARPVPLCSATEAWTAGVAQGAANAGCNRLLNQWAIITGASAPGYNDAIALMTQLPGEKGSTASQVGSPNVWVTQCLVNQYKTMCKRIH